MSVEAVGASDETLDANFQYMDKTETIWNGRSVSVGNINNHDPGIILCGAYLGSVYGTSQPISPFWGYFDSEAKKKNEFDVALYQYHVRCNSEESKKALESAFEKMAYGMVGVVVGVICLPINGIFSIQIYECGKMVWQGIEDFKRSMETRGVNLDEVSFVTWTEDLKRNTDELMKNSILEPWTPLPTPNYHYNENPHYTKPLDSWRYA